MLERILILALRGRDADVAANILGKHGYEATTCSGVDALAIELERGAGAALITEESLVGVDPRPLADWLASQPTWSDFPVILIATKRVGRRNREARAMLDMLGNVVVLERPIHAETLTSAAGSALRGRRRQYEARARLHALQEAEGQLTQLNTGLETRIAQRTAELSAANNQLMQEIAQRERTQAALVQSQKMEAVGQLTGGIAHDFNNLLTVVTGNLDLIDRRTTEDRVRRHARLAGEAAERAGKLTQQLLAFSRTQQLALGPIHLNALIEGMTDLLERTIGPKIVQQRMLDPSMPWVLGDAQQLELALLNLAINARDAMPKGGILSIETHLSGAPPERLSPGTYGIIRVRDGGEGIPPKILSKVFDPFFTTKPLGKGTGLGLSQVFGITQQSGGTVQIASEEGKGTTVDLWLPLVSAPRTDEEQSGSTLQVDRAASGSLMVVDDDQGVREFMVESLEMLGHHVVQAAGGAQALKLIAASPPDVLIVDFAMPGLSGAEVAKRAKTIASGVPVILVTGYAETDDVLEGQFASILRKPFHISDLDRAVRAALRQVEVVS